MRENESDKCDPAQQKVLPEVQGLSVIWVPPCNTTIWQEAQSNLQYIVNQTFNKVSGHSAFGITLPRPNSPANSFYSSNVDIISFWFIAVKSVSKLFQVSFAHQYLDLGQIAPVGSPS